MGALGPVVGNHVLPRGNAVRQQVLAAAALPVRRKNTKTDESGRASVVGWDWRKDLKWVDNERERECVCV